MIAQGLLLLCAVTYSQAFLFNPRPQQWVPVPIFKPPQKHIIQHVPIVKHVREPVYVNRIISVPQYIDRAVPAPYPVQYGGAIGGGISSGDDDSSSTGSFGINAQIEDADTVNIVAGVSGPSIGSAGSIGYGYNNNNNNNVRRSIGGLRRSVGGVRRSIGGVRRTVGGFRRSVGGVRRAVGGFRRSVGGVRRSVGGFRRFGRGIRRSVGVRRGLRGFNDNQFNERFDNEFNDDLLRRGFRDSRGILRGGRFNN